MRLREEDSEGDARVAGFGWSSKHEQLSSGIVKEITLPWTIKSGMLDSDRVQKGKS